MSSASSVARRRSQSGRGARTRRCVRLYSSMRSVCSRFRAPCAPFRAVSSHLASGQSRASRGDLLQLFQARELAGLRSIELGSNGASAKQRSQIAACPTRSALCHLAMRASMRGAQGFSPAPALRPSSTSTCAMVTSVPPRSRCCCSSDVGAGTTRASADSRAPTHPWMLAA